ncbi:MAG: 2-succinyl-6-hydroxy-2,4-cyclohexadiene-1-carboxylate synthase [Myxococcota bacterium]|nr:2-succinyl-6-hydroxy-2,4-cyclohexadiene-1-carboxylate synthase [Myxococcota bacterium]
MFGHGPQAIYGLHGWGGDHNTFAPLERLIPAGYRILSPDMPGYGASAPPERWDIPSIAREIARDMEPVPGGPMIFLGNCSGALLGLYAVMLAPHRFRRLVLIDPFAWMPWYFRVFTVPGGEIPYYSTFANPLGRLIANASLSRRMETETGMVTSFGSVNHAVTLRYLRLLGGIRGVDDFAALRLPVDIVHGERTFQAIRDGLSRWRRIWPHLKVHELKGAAHLPIQEAPEELARVLFAG